MMKKEVSQMLTEVFAGASRYIVLLVQYAAVGFLGSYLLVRLLGRLKVFQPYRLQGPKTHFEKGDVPTGGGLVFIVGIAIFWAIEWFMWHSANLFGSPWDDHAFKSITIICAGVIVCGLIGFIDDLMKFTYKASIGLPARYKFLLQLLVGAIASNLLTPESSQLALPLCGKSWELQLPFAIIIGALVFAGVVNGVNFSDGLDGLASGSIIITLIGVNLLAILFYMSHLTGITIAATGLVLGFFMLNLKPARIFMGDTGSYALGALIALLCISAGLHVYVLLIGIVYVVEVLSVMLQVTSFKLTGRRIFRMSPIHHHFEELGWREESIVVYFWLVQAIGCTMAVLMAF